MEYVLDDQFIVFFPLSLMSKGDKIDDKEINELMCLIIVINDKEGNFWRDEIVWFSLMSNLVIQMDSSSDMFLFVFGVAIEFDIFVLVVVICRKSLD